MQMRNALAAVRAVVDDQSIAGLGETRFVGHRPGGQEEVSEEGLVFRPGLPDSRDRFPWHDQNVNGGLRVEIVEGHHIVVLINDGGGYFFGGDSLENGLGHTNQTMV